MKAYIHTKSRNKDGTYSNYQTQSVPVKETERPWKGRTASGYGVTLPTEYMVFYQGKWRRVKAICFSNCATLYIGRSYDPQITVQIEKIESAYGTGE